MKIFLLFIFFTFQAYAQEYTFSSGNKSFNALLNEVITHYPKASSIEVLNKTQTEGEAEVHTSNSSCTTSGFCYKCGFRKTFSNPFMGKMGCGYGHHLNCDGKKEIVKKTFPVYEEIKVQVLNKKNKVLATLSGRSVNPVSSRHSSTEGSCRK